MDCLMSQQTILFDEMVGSWKLDREIEEITPIALSSIEKLDDRLRSALTDEDYQSILLWNGFHIKRLDKRTQSTQHDDEYYLVGKIPSTTMERYTVDDDLVFIAGRIAWFKEIILPGLLAHAKRIQRTENISIERKELISSALRYIRAQSVRMYISERTRVFAEQRMKNVNTIRAAQKLIHELTTSQHQLQHLLHMKPLLNKLDKHFAVITTLYLEEDDENEVTIMKNEGDKVVDEQ
mmetsp:Transcript_7007/g.26145  ORF Transcript_7007/g.26145 Transcript_7007/m.26145 type:complete len:237 (+) Transcript_7007:2515-3225(+)